MTLRRVSGIPLLPLVIACAAWGASPMVGAQAATTAASSTAATVTATATARMYAVPPGPLAPALNAFAALAGVFVSADGALTDSLRSAGVQGTRSVAEAFSALLAGTGLAAVPRPDGSYLIQPAPPPIAAASATSVEVLPTVTVTARAERPAPGLLAPTTLGGGPATAQRDVPQSLSVVSQERIQSQALTTLQEALQNTPGVTTTNVDTSRYRVYSRGFQIDTLQYDGVSTAVGYLTPPNLAMYQQVEVLRGPASLVAGIAGAGGTMNLVRKKAPRSFEASALLGAGSQDTRRAGFDIGGPLSDDGHVRGLLVAAEDRNALPQDGTYRHDRQLYGVIEADVSAQTTWRLGASRQQLDARSMQYGYPTYTDGSFLRVPLSTYYGADWNHEGYSLATAFADVTRQLGGGWRARVSALSLDARRSTAFAGLRSAVDPTRDTTWYQTSTSSIDDRQRIVDAYLSGPVEAFGRVHDLAFGLNQLWQHTPQSGAPGSPRLVAVSLADPGVVPVARFDSQVSRQVTDTAQLSLFAHANLKLTDAWTLVADGRVVRWRSRLRADPLANASGVADHDDGLAPHFSPTVALLHALDARQTIYASDAQVFTPQSRRDVAGELLPPMKARQQEVGWKRDGEDGRWAASAALFRLLQSNRAMTAPGDTTGTLFVAQGRARSQGLELQLSAELARGWDVSAGYTFTHTRYLDDSADTGRAAFSAFTPRHLLKLWTEARLGGGWAAWTLGAGLHASSAFSARDSVAEVRQPGYATVDGLVRYAIDAKTSLSLHVENLFDRRYYQSISSTADHNYPGNPRRVVLVLRAHY
ncbi:MAG: TonB-dependent siderophore receptor [Pseudomonadota bacterium]